MVLFAPRYVLWHYTTGFFAFFRIWWNFVWFTQHFFGISNLTQSLFAPWKRVTDRPDRKWSLEAIASAFIVNVMSRLIGFLLRFVLIFIGITAILLLLSTGVLVLVAWLCAPVVIVSLLAYSLYNMAAIFI